MVDSSLSSASSMPSMLYSDSSLALMSGRVRGGSGDGICEFTALRIEMRRRDLCRPMGR